MNPNPNPAPKPAPIGNINEAERAIANLNTIMDRLVETVEQETARVRVGRLRDALQNDAAKVELARAYQGLATIKERGGNVAEAQKLRGRAVDIFTRLRGAAQTE